MTTKRSMLANGTLPQSERVPERVSINRKRALEEIWRNTQPDYRGEVNKTRFVLVKRDGECVTSAVENLTNEEVRQKLPGSLRHRFRG